MFLSKSPPAIPLSLRGSDQTVRPTGEDSMRGGPVCKGNNAAIVSMNSLHDRMPVNSDLWLDFGMKNIAAASDLLKPYDARLMRRYPVPVASFP
jgi:hypothetical protein